MTAAVLAAGSTAGNLVELADARGVVLSAVANELWAEGDLPADLADQLRTHRAELLAHLERWDRPAAAARCRAADELAIALGPAALRDPRVKAAADRAARALRRCDRAGVLAACEDLESHARRAAEGRESS